MQLAIHQDPRRLTLSLLEQEIELPITILESQEVIVGEWTIDFAIIGESHQVTIRHGKVFVVREVLACVAMPNREDVKAHSFSDLQPYRHQHRGYQVEVSFTNKTVPLWDDVQLTMRFPTVYGQQPLTQIRWQILVDRVQWQTLHVYPLPQRSVTVLSRSYWMR